MLEVDQKAKSFQQCSLSGYRPTNLMKGHDVDALRLTLDEMLPCLSKSPRDRDKVGNK